MLRRKQISFDLDTNVLKQIHGEKNYIKAYSDIRSFMESSGFEHIEGSVYASKSILDDSEVLEIIDDLKEKYEYLDKSVKELHQTDIGETHSLGYCFDYDGTPGKFAQKYQEKSSDATQNSKANTTANASASQTADYRKQITFDLDTGVLKQIHGEKNYTKAYSDIRSFMESSGFEHIEGSAYASKSVMSNFDVLKVIDKLKEKHKYLDKSVREIHQTDIDNIHSINGQFDYDGTPGKFAQMYQENGKTDDTRNRASENKSTKLPDMNSRFAKAANLTMNITDNGQSDFSRQWV